MSKYTTDLVPFATRIVNELRPEVLGFDAMNMFAGTNSASRRAMWSKQGGQILVCSGTEPRYLQTGVEREYAKNTFSIKFKNNSRILDVVEKFPHTYGKNQVAYSPMKAVIFENADDPEYEIDVLYLQDFHCMHHYFGFQYKYDKEVLSRIRPKAHIKAGTIVANSPNVTPQGDYQYGINANVVLSSHPAGTEDGVLISESFAKKLTTRVYETREFSFGNGIIPLNCYGNDEEYKIFPDIGEHVREDGVICSLREYVPELAPCDLSVKELQNVTTFDKSKYATPGSKVVDITVIKGSGANQDILTDMDTQAVKYHERHMEFYRQIISLYEHLRKQQNGHIRISRELHRLIVEGMAFLDNKVTLNKKRKRLPPWTVQITTMYELPAENGFKITDTHGGKSVTVAIKPDHEMPVDKMGNVTDIIVADKSTISRLIKGKLHEHYIGASRRDTTHRVRDMVAKYNGNIPDEVYEEVFEYLLGFYKIVSPTFYEKIGRFKPDIKRHVDAVVKRGIFVHLPTDNPVSYMDVARLLRKYYPACNGKLTFVDYFGNTVETANDIIIGQIYYVLLEKVANDYSAVSSAKLQHFGLPSKPSGESKYSEPIKMTPVRFGESEYRLFVATAGGRNTAELADRSNNISVHENTLQNLLNAAQPSNVYNLVDRKTFPIGQGFLQRVIHHEFKCLGLKMVRSGDDYER